MCANQTCSSVLAVSAPPQGTWNRFTVMKAMAAVVEAFQEALEMRRAAQRIYFLSDE
jgi:hypothetical protein